MQDWAALAEAIDARMTERGMTQRDLAEHSGVSPATLQRIRAATPQRRSPVTLAALSRALGWPDDHLRRVLRADEITRESVAGDDDSTAGRLDTIDARVQDLAQRVQRLERRD